MAATGHRLQGAWEGGRIGDGPERRPPLVPRNLLWRPPSPESRSLHPLDPMRVVVKLGEHFPTYPLVPCIKLLPSIRTFALVIAHPSKSFSVGVLIS